MHEHAHHHHHGHQSGKRLRAAFFLNLMFAVLEVVGGLWTNSMAILSDALHDLGDSVALGMAWFLDRLAQRKGDAVFSFGYRRFSLLGALINALILFGGSLIILVNAVPRILSPEGAYAPGMIAFALLGIVVNGAAVLRLKGGATENERVVTWHLLEDVLGWVAVLVVSVVMLFFDAPVLDPILAVLVTLYVLWNVIKSLKRTLILFLQGVPETILLGDVEAAILAVEGVQSVHHIHVWSQDGEHHVLTAHVVADQSVSLLESQTLRQNIQEAVRKFGIGHTTIEIEDPHGEGCPAGADCY